MSEKELLQTKLNEVNCKITSLDIEKKDIEDQIKKIDYNIFMKKAKEEELKNNVNFKILKIPVKINGTDHDGYCSGNDGYELEEETGFFIISTIDLIDMYNMKDCTKGYFTPEMFKDENFNENGEFMISQKNFFFSHKHCTANGSGYCSTYLDYESSGPFIWLKDYTDYCEIVFPDFSGTPKKYDTYDDDDE